MKGFTLVELSIVLVIIGLIVGGIVGGKSLIHTAELYSVVSDLKKHEIGYRTFKMQYDSKPGDIVDAVDYWGSDVENGNGDGIINYSEHHMAWEHLGRADLIDGEYDGQEYANDVNVIGINRPAGPLPNSGFILSAWDGTADFLRGMDPGCIEISALKETLIFGAGMSQQLLGGALTGYDTRFIDKKMDDGNAVGGKVRGIHHRSYDCLYGCHDYGNGHNYELTGTDINCRVGYHLE